MVTPLTLPADYNPDTYMIAKTTEYGTFHESRRAARLAAELVANGTPEDLALAECVLDATLACQETDPNDPHVGNFYWMREDTVVEDLNAVEFVLEALIPMMRAHGERLSEAMQQRVLAAIRLGLKEIDRLDVLPLYTNITALDIVNTCLGGELLDDRFIYTLAWRKMDIWIRYLNHDGHPLEYNSPTYTGVTLRALKRLADGTTHERIRTQAKAISARLALSVALHIHGDGVNHGTGRWAGPHSRAYHPSVVGETPPEIERVRGWLADGVLPEWVGTLLDARPERFQITETAGRDRNLSFTTYHTPAYALGVASASFHTQSDVCMLHYRHPGDDYSQEGTRPGVFYTRYVLDDKWFGDAYHATDRTKSRNLPDEGDFLGVQDGNRAIGVYAAPLPLHCSSAKLAFIWTQLARIDEIWIGEQRIDPQRIAEEPVAATLDDVIVIGSGDVYTAIRPLHLTPLGRETPVQLVERDGDLVLEIYNYRGPKKAFWEMRWPHAFYQGRALCAFYLEVAERGEYGDGAAMAQAVASGEIEYESDPSFTRVGDIPRETLFSYTREKRTLGIELERMTFTLQRRWTERGELAWPMLDAAPLAREVTGGTIRMGDVWLEGGDGPVWLLSVPEHNLHVGGSRSLEPTTATLTTPHGTYTAQGMMPVVMSTPSS